jgi:hypothetical protein
MRRFLMLVVAATAAALSSLGCSSDSDDGGSNNGGSAGSALAQCVGSNSEYTPAEFLAETEPGYGCSAASDVNSVCANNLPLIGGTCGKGCLGMGDDAAQAACVSGCIQAEVAKSHSAALSEDCMACYTSDIECARKNCLVPCGLDPAGSTCFTCRTDKGCVDAFYSCSGLPQPGMSDGGGGEGGS